MGYIEGQNMVLSGDFTRKERSFPAIAAELVRLKVDVIVTGRPKLPVLPKKRRAQFHSNGK